MNKKLALLTESKWNSIYHPTHLLLGLYNLEFSGSDYDMAKSQKEVVDVVMGQLDWSSKIFHGTTFEDSKSLQEIALELCKKYNGRISSAQNIEEYSKIVMFEKSRFDEILKEIITSISSSRADTSLSRPQG